MATIKLAPAKNVNALLRYCEKKAIEKQGIDCDPDHAKEQMKLTRELWNKDEGIKGHHIIQSFSPEDNITKEQANEIGRKLAEQVAPHHQVMIYTHNDNGKMHNHIVVNAVHQETGLKYHSDREQLYKIREVSDELCREYGFQELSKTPPAKERFSQAEYKLAARGEILWKDELKAWIDHAKTQTSSLKDMQSYLKEHFNVEMKIQNKNVSFLHPERQRYCRGKTLGGDYDKGALENEYARTNEASREVTPTREEQHDRTRDILFRDTRGHQDPGSQPEGLQQADTGRHTDHDRHHAELSKASERGSRGLEKASRFSRPDTKSLTRTHAEPPEQGTGRVPEDSSGSSESQRNLAESIRRETDPDQAPALQTGHDQPIERAGGNNHSFAPSNPALEAIKQIGKGIEQELARNEQEAQQQHQRVKGKKIRNQSRYDRER